MNANRIDTGDRRFLANPAAAVVCPGRFLVRCLDRLNDDEHRNVTAMRI